MTFEPKLMIALPIETDIKLFTDWLYGFSNKIFFNIAQEDGTIVKYYSDLHFQDIPGGHSGLYKYHINLELKNVKDTGDLIQAENKWYVEYEEFSQSTASIGSVRVERVNNNSIKVFFWSDLLGDYFINVFKQIFNDICHDFFLNHPPENMVDENIQPGQSEFVPPEIEPSSLQYPIEETDPDILLADTQSMKNIYSDYNPNTAKTIYKAIPSAWNEHQRVGRRWGPGFVSKVCNINKDTVGRYLRAFWYAGLKEIKTASGTIPLPYTPRSKTDS